MGWFSHCSWDTYYYTTLFSSKTSTTARANFVPQSMIYPDLLRKHGLICWHDTPRSPQKAAIRSFSGVVSQMFSGWVQRKRGCWALEVWVHGAWYAKVAKKFLNEIILWINMNYLKMAYLSNVIGIMLQLQGPLHLPLNFEGFQEDSLVVSVVEVSPECNGRGSIWLT